MSDELIGRVVIVVPDGREPYIAWITRVNDDGTFVARCTPPGEQPRWLLEMSQGD